MSHYSFSPHTSYSKPGSPNAQKCPGRPEIPIKNKHAAKKPVHNDDPGQDHVSRQHPGPDPMRGIWNPEPPNKRTEYEQAFLFIPIDARPGKLDLGKRRACAHITYGRALGRRTVSVRDGIRQNLRFPETFRSPDCLIDFGHAPRAVELGALRLMAMRSG